MARGPEARERPPMTGLILLAALGLLCIAWAVCLRSSNPT